MRVAHGHGRARFSHTRGDAFLCGRWQDDPGPFAGFFRNGPANRKDVAMDAQKNLTATRRTVAALVRAELLTESDVALVRLAYSTARALDKADHDDTPAYAFAQVARAHADIVTRLYKRAAAGTPSDDTDALLADLLRATPGDSDTADA